MKKSKQKKRQRDSDEDTIDRLQKEIRELKSLNRSLLRRLKKVDRDYEEPEVEESEPYIEPIKRSIRYCPTCSKGELEEVIIESLGKKYMKCTGHGCRYRSSTVKI